MRSTNIEPQLTQTKTSQTILSPDSIEATINYLKANITFVKKNIDTILNNQDLEPEELKKRKEAIKDILDEIDSEFEFCKDIAKKLCNGEESVYKTKNGKEARRVLHRTTKDGLDVFFEEVRNKNKEIKPNVQEFHINYNRVKRKARDKSNIETSTKIFTIEQFKQSRKLMKSYQELKTNFLNKVIKINQNQLLVNEIASTPPDKILSVKMLENSTTSTTTGATPTITTSTTTTGTTSTTTTGAIPTSTTLTTTRKPKMTENEKAIMIEMQMKEINKNIMETQIKLMNDKGYAITTSTTTTPTISTTTVTTTTAAKLTNKTDTTTTTTTTPVAKLSNKTTTTTTAKHTNKPTTKTTTATTKPTATAKPSLSKTMDQKSTEKQKPRNLSASDYNSSQQSETNLTTSKKSQGNQKISDKFQRRESSVFFRFTSSFGNTDSPPSRTPTDEGKKKQTKLFRHKSSYPLPDKHESSSEKRKTPSNRK